MVAFLMGVSTHLKNNKAPGLDGLPIELLKADPDLTALAPTILVVRVHSSQMKQRKRPKKRRFEQLLAAASSTPH